MDSIRVTGGNRLNGSIPISGAKNAALPLMIASILSPETLTLENVPRLTDVQKLAQILNNLGIDVTIAGKRPGQGEGYARTMRLNAANIVDTTAPYELVSQMRASFWVLGPLLARCGKARVSLPGGCAIGTRPVDMHLMGLEKLGAEIELDSGYVNASAPNGLTGTTIHFDKVSVGATHNVLMAASMAKGTTVLENAACEPEIGDVARCLAAMGAKIEGIDTNTLVIEGAQTMHGTTHTVLPDRIETGTYAMAVAMAGGDVMLENARADLLQSALDVLVEAGAKVEASDKGIRVSRNGNGIKPVNVETAPHPGFPTDLQAQLMALMTRAEGVSTITESIFENRFMHVQELARLGADIKLDGDTATITGVQRMKGAPVMATDLRASVSLIIAGLAAEGQTTVNRVYHLDRGFERIEEKLGNCGAQIERLSA
ncbi:UDP-N-acetylglucosamine 1-carboxyvinyltransferase [Tepidamorphus sp. 3E244]|uniref:UDP-N-acetylglucosamine 1-carboxyvinyltransferase n=1 Tax=Tepidamorphus sp. 3E244 TaxID=3385498 RepID=UPI0038FC649D